MQMKGNNPRILCVRLSLCGKNARKPKHRLGYYFALGVPLVGVPTDHKPHVATPVVSH